MNEFLQIITSLPTVIFTGLLGVCVVYWLFVVIGAIDIDAFGGGAEGAADGALDGAADGALHGAADAALHGAADAALHGAADAALHGAADAALHGAADAALHGAADAALHGAADAALHGAADAALHGAADAALHGAADAALHGAADAALHGAADAALHGATDGVVHGAGDGLAHGATDGVADGGQDGGSVEGAKGLLDFLGLKGIPITIVISVLTFFSWILSFFGSKYLMALSDHVLLRFALGTGIFGLALFASLVATSFVVRPLRAVFSDKGQQFGGHNLLGRTVTVTTLLVDSKFGQARWAEEGHDMLLFVRCPEPNALGKGSKAMVIDYDSERRIYQIVPLEEAFGEELALPPASTRTTTRSLSQSAGARDTTDGANSKDATNASPPLSANEDRKPTR